MNTQTVDQDFVRESWEDADHARDYVEAVAAVGLWESERRLMDRYVPRDGAVLDIGCGGAGRRSACTTPATFTSRGTTCPPQ